jgi:hypothetical protein
VVEKGFCDSVVEYLAVNCGVGASSAKPCAILYLKLVLTTVFWGGTFVAGRMASREAAPFRPPSCGLLSHPFFFSFSF